MGSATSQFTESSHGSPVESACGAEETRTPDFLLAKEALYQLSYGPAALRAAGTPILRACGARELWIGHGPTPRSGVQVTGVCKPTRSRVGVSGLEPEASAVSGPCSNQLS